MRWHSKANNWSRSSRMACTAAFITGSLDDSIIDSRLASSPKEARQIKRGVIRRTRDRWTKRWFQMRRKISTQQESKEVRVIIQSG
jgi:predicted NAD-dependent protein-ADP-ribosyltransferase YbiA (DUF1768 family)